MRKQTADIVYTDEMKMKIDPETFGQNLGEVLEEKNIRQVDFAKMICGTKPYVNAMIRGRTVPSFKYLCAILVILDVKFERLVRHVK